MSAASFNAPAELLRSVTRRALGSVNTPAGASPQEDVPLNLPDSIIDWLAKLSLLYGVPFEYLVPDNRLLPVESIRFFYLDPNWIQRVIDGALSTGTMCSRDNVFNQTFFQQVYEAVQAAIPKVRQTVQGSPQPAQLTVGATTTGFLFRSAAVSGYPGLEVVPTASNQPVPILRLDRLSPNIMLALFNGIPDHIEIRQPPEGLHFGISRPNDKTPTFTPVFRWLGHTKNAADQPGTQINPAPTCSLKISSTGVIDAANGVNAIVQALGKAYLGDPIVFTSAEFAVDMVQSAGVQPYDIHPPTQS